MKYWLYDTYNNLKADAAASYKSWTIIFNSAVGTIATFLPDLITLMPDLQEYIEAPTYKTWMLVLLIGNFLLRFKTTKALRDK